MYSSFPFFVINVFTYVKETADIYKLIKDTWNTARVKDQSTIFLTNVTLLNNDLVPCSNVSLEKLLVDKVTKKFRTFYRTSRSWPCPREPAICLTHNTIIHNFGPLLTISFLSGTILMLLLYLRLYIQKLLFFFELQLIYLYFTRLMLVVIYKSGFPPYEFFFQPSSTLPQVQNFPSKPYTFPVG